MAANYHTSFNPEPLYARQGGVSLIIVLIMLVIIGLTSAAAIRNATSGEKVTNNIRLQNLAQQYAEAALRFCESELVKATATRVANLADPMITTVTDAAASLHNSEGATSPVLAWQRTATWIGSAGTGLSSTRTVLSEAQVKSSDSAFRPTRLPECVAERGLSVGTPPITPIVVTARGFSLDYAADVTTGKTTSGSVVWLQSTLIIQ